MTGDRSAHWDARYAAADQLWSVGPHPELVAEVERLVHLPGRRALDLGAGDGRHAVWLARHGFEVTALDFSPVGVERGRGHALQSGVLITWVCADVREWEPPGGEGFSLVLVSYLHLDDAAMARVRSSLAPGGVLIVIGHAVRNLTEGSGGPRNPAYLHTVESLRAKAGDLVVERCEEVTLSRGAGVAIDVVLVARKSAPAGVEARTGTASNTVAGTRHADQHD